ncbi:hypothetical protein KSD_00070 [Ktedonobacter sp. SOSP1-85]|uniref:hypothetical protein n=1 Tax=Ktedonobacter sp. SOSP1-85 TaxID=2778367 RepID=UPI001915C8FE|nr:hypothetical protein [Ktedonobacter sp. SOSP1-85]GHO72236.1 hypothetical protein KSD_00070 [Ktedonobacter sp. SOSP1-85]
MPDADIVGELTSLAQTVERLSPVASSIFDFANNIMLWWYGEDGEIKVFVSDDWMWLGRRSKETDGEQVVRRTLGGVVACAGPTGSGAGGANQALV